MRGMKEPKFIFDEIFPSKTFLGSSFTPYNKQFVLVLNVLELSMHIFYMSAHCSKIGLWYH